MIVPSLATIEYRNLGYRHVLTKIDLANEYQMHSDMKGKDIWVLWTLPLITQYQHDASLNEYKQTQFSNNTIFFYFQQISAYLSWFQNTQWKFVILSHAFW